MHIPVAVAADDFAGWVGLLADRQRAGRAYWHLLASGAAALPAVREGLSSPSADVRLYCAKVLDHLVDEESFGDLVGLLDDPDPGVRCAALHALACDRCKDNACRPDKATVLPKALELLRRDPSPHVRAHACGVVGRWAHTDDAAIGALTAASSDDPAPAVRKKAAWYARGGPIFRKTAPR